MIRSIRFIPQLTAPVKNCRSFHRVVKAGQSYLGPSFCFDIDGVLKQGEHVLPEAKEALQILSGNNASNTRYPFILVTNGGGTLEADRAKKLSRELGVEITEDQLILAHTPFKLQALEYQDKPIFVVGGKDDICRSVAHSYGFKNVFIPADLLDWNPSIWPFETLTDKEKGYVRKADFSKINFAAVFVFHDSRDWGRDTQLIVDLLRSVDGVFGTCKDLNDSAQWKPESQLNLFLSAEDLLWSNNFSQVRLGQGAFHRALEGVWKAVTGVELNKVVCGKPHKSTYDYASNMLKKVIDPTTTSTKKITSPVYFVGDNPKSDISGANAYNWQSILVRTGVFRGGINDVEHPAKFVANDVLGAVKWALEKEKQII